MKKIMGNESTKKNNMLILIIFFLIKSNIFMYKSIVMSTSWPLPRYRLPLVNRKKTQLKLK